MRKGWMYILECADGSYYTGSTNNLELRLVQHQTGQGANHTKKRLPVKLVYYEEYQNVADAFKREKQVQGWNRKKKEALINGTPELLPELAVAYKDRDGAFENVRNGGFENLSHHRENLLPEALEGNAKGWEIKKFENCIKKVVYTKKIKRKEFKSNGEYPIISQEQEFVNGYWENSDDLFEIKKPIVIFGDHTKIVKYVDFDFVLGADGVKILQTIDEIDPRYFYYYLQNIDLGDLGYARHYRLLKEQKIKYPPLPEQKRIVAILDRAFSAIERSRNNAEQNLKNAKELFESYLNRIFEEKGEDWEEKTIEKVCRKIFAGGDKPKEFSKFRTDKYQIPIYANAVKDKGLYGFTNITRVENPSVTISARGSGTGHTEIRYEPFFPIVRLIVLIPDLDLVELEFLKHIIDNLEILRSGSAIPQLTVPMIKEYEITLPPIEKQKKIVQKLDQLQSETKKLEAIYQKKIEDLEELKKSILQKAFNGEL